MVYGMPRFLTLLSVVGTAAMIWVGGGIIVHGLEYYGVTAIGHGIHDASEWAARALPAIGSFIAWVVAAALSGVAGLIVGAAAIPLAGYVIAPAWRVLKGALPRRARAA